jgi:hypothetical protein
MLIHCGRQYRWATRCRRWYQAIALAVCSVFAAAASADWIAELMQSFADSDIQFQRTDSNVPFFPVAFLGATYYSDVELTADDVTVASFDQTTISQGAGLPILLSSRDALVVGEYLSWTRFDSRSDAFESFDAYSAGLPVGWFRQVDNDTQAAAFVMPLAHKATLRDSSWSWEYLGGAFGREQVNDTFWWGYGVFFDAGEGEDYALPYLAGSWELNEQLTLSATMPWPAVLYAPTRDTLWRFGAAPSSAAWSLSADQDNLFYQLGSWDFGLGFEKRLGGNFWGVLEGGVAGLRSLRITSDDIEGPEFDIESGPFIRIGVNFRPAMLN